MVAHGAYANAVHESQTPLMVAVGANRLPIVRVLLEAGMRNLVVCVCVCVCVRARARKKQPDVACDLR